MNEYYIVMLDKGEYLHYYYQGEPEEMEEYSQDLPGVLVGLDWFPMAGNDEMEEN